ncbi:hypothetical protein VNO77_25403 [Canavalia gladiata]|uniref:Uncharacterized protein n=1 Tax=Canavalia gladiata TaxID=3824 RepID=A0AAN9L833_CANGL
MLLLEAKEGTDSQLSKEDNSFILFLQVLDGEFRSSLQGNSSNELELCVESGDPATVTSQFLNAVFMNLWVLAKHSGSFSLRETKQATESGAPDGLKDFVSEIKSTFGLKYVYVWHTLLGLWGGLDPNASGAKKYDPKLRCPVLSPGNLANTRDMSIDAMEKYGIGVIDPAKVSEFYNDLHSYLVSQNVDGVKVDVQNILETISCVLGGRVFLTRHFQQELEKSISTNFQDNSIICCMGHNTDSIYHSKQNWDMFYSLHDAAEFHAVARAVGGCGVYVSVLAANNHTMPL